MLTYKNPMKETTRSLDYELRDLNDLASFELRFDCSTGFTTCIMEIHFKVANETYKNRNNAMAALGH